MASPALVARQASFAMLHTSGDLITCSSNQDRSVKGDRTQRIERLPSLFRYTLNAAVERVLATDDVRRSLLNGCLSGHSERANAAACLDCTAGYDLMLVGYPKRLAQLSTVKQTLSFVVEWIKSHSGTVISM
ncbi:MAG: hypothetical protein V4772_11815, partial [Pseudomonadota bacterium]